MSFYSVETVLSSLKYTSYNNILYILKNNWLSSNKMVSKTLQLVLILLLNLSLATALTGSIGNSRMVLRSPPDVEVEKYILVKNVNNVSVKIEMMVGGDLKDNVKLQDNNFTLSPGEEKKAYFTIKADEEGATTTKINVKFIPEQGNAVGLSSTITFIAGSGENSDDDQTNVRSQNSSQMSPFKTMRSNIKISPTNLLLISTMVLSAILIVLFAYSLTKHKKRAKSNA